MMEPRQDHFLYPFFKRIIRFFYPKIEVIGWEQVPNDEPVIFVGNHSQIHGPVSSVLYLPGKRLVWCAGEMMKREEIPEYAFRDFWSFKPKWTHGFYRMLSHLITPIALVLLNSSETLPVYKDTRVISTFRQSVAAMQDGYNLVIFPEQNILYNQIIYDFQDKFIDVARFYNKKTGKNACFVPMYLAPKLKKMYIGTPIRFDSSVPIELERERIKRALMDSITSIACSLPRHTVIPYRNIPRKNYPTNI